MRGASLRVIWLRPTGPGLAATDLLQRWSEKYPEVALTRRPGPAWTRDRAGGRVPLGPTGRGGDGGPPAGGWAARALIDRAGCPVAVVAE